MSLCLPNEANKENVEPLSPVSIPDWILKSCHKEWEERQSGWIEPEHLEQISRKRNFDTYASKESAVPILSDLIFKDSSHFVGDLQGDYPPPNGQLPNCWDAPIPKDEGCTLQRLEELARRTANTVLSQTPNGQNCAPSSKEVLCHLEAALSEAVLSGLPWLSLEASHIL